MRHHNQRQKRDEYHCIDRRMRSKVDQTVYGHRHDPGQSAQRHSAVEGCSVAQLVSSLTNQRQNEPDRQDHADQAAARQ